MDAVTGGLTAAALGPRRTIVLASVPCILGWLLIALSPNLALLLVARLLTGFGSAITSAICSMLVSQYSSVGRRGPFLTLFTLMVSTGILVVYCVGAVVSWIFSWS